MTRDQFAFQIAQKLETSKDALQAYWKNSHPVRHFYIDDLLPKEWALACYEALPPTSELLFRNTDKERKHVGVAVESYNPLVGEILYAFQDERVIRTIEAITGIEALQKDESLYGSGISLMEEGSFLMPHLDNSHDGDSKLYRVLNTLYYITPEWPEHKGGNLELWDKSMKERVEIHSRFNRLAVMETHTASIHGVNKVTHHTARACISNYYFSTKPVNSIPYTHKTTFFARPEDPTIKKLKFRLEGQAKNFLSKFFDNKSRKTKHRRKL